ncbi:Mitosis inhibitor protein kinase wee1, partial [Coemansia sp. Cherry 401B]
NGPDWHKLREGCFDDPVFDDLPYSAELLELVKLMLHPQPARRPTLAQVGEQCRRCAGAATPLPSDDEGEDFVRIRRQHSFAGFARPARPALLRAATAGSADELQSSSAHPMVTRSAAKAGSDGGGLARRTASAPGTAAIF